MIEINGIVSGERTSVCCLKMMKH